MTQETGSSKNRVLTTREKLAEVREAIHDLMVGRISSYQIGRRTITYYKLADLRAYERTLLAELRAEEGDGATIAGAYVTFFDGR